MAVPRQSADGIEHILGNCLTCFPFGHDFVHLCLGRNIAGQKEVPEGLDSRIGGVGGLGERCERLRDGLATEADPFLGVKIGNVGNQAADVTGAADALVDVLPGR